MKPNLFWSSRKGNMTEGKLNINLEMYDNIVLIQLTENTCM